MKDAEFLVWLGDFNYRVDLPEGFAPDRSNPERPVNEQLYHFVLQKVRCQQGLLQLGGVARLQAQCRPHLDACRQLCNTPAAPVRALCPPTSLSKNKNRPNTHSTANALQIAARQHTDLLTGDQCGREMARGSIFQGLAEGPIRFLPTYKFEKNRESSAMQPFYDQGEKMRVPAWTDRVFFRASAPQRVALQPNAPETAADVRVRAGWGGRRRPYPHAPAGGCMWVLPAAGVLRVGGWVGGAGRHRCSA